MSKHFEFFDNLRLAPIGQEQLVSGKQVVEILPPRWREERVKDAADWFIKTGRGLGFEIRHMVDRDYFVVWSEPT